MPEATPAPEETEQEPVGLNPVILLAVLAVLAGGGALAYFKRGEKQTQDQGQRQSG